MANARWADLQLVGADDARVEWCLRALVIVVGLWLLAAALLVNVEYGDGYSTVANAQYFLGTSGEYFWQRGPVMALLLVPGEWAAQRLGLEALDVRPHHGVMALLHLSYLIGVWRLLAGRFGATVPTLLGFVAAIPTVVYFSYAPFVSHDLFPGLIVLLMVFVADRYSRLPSRSDWLLFLALSSLIVLVKQTYAIVPPAVLLGRVLAAGFEAAKRRDEIRRMLLLAAAVAIAGVICWLTYAALVGGRFPEVPFLLRPWAMIQQIGLAYGEGADLTQLFYEWVYVRNASAYGIVAMTLLLPGIAMALWRGDTWLRQVALTWLLLLTAMALTPFKEVRYLAFLAPLSASLIVPVLRQIQHGPPRYSWLLGLVLLLDVARVVPEAIRIRQPYYREGVTGFFAPLAHGVDPQAPIFFGQGWLNFVSPDRSAFFGDAFHRVTEMHVDQIRLLYGWKPERVFRIQIANVAAAMSRHADAVFLLQNTLLFRRAPFRAGNTEGLPQEFVQSLSRVEDAEFLRIGDRYVAASSPQMPRLLVRSAELGGDPVIVAGGVDAELLRRFAGFEGLPDRVSLRVLIVSRLCRLDGCESFGD